MYGFAILSVLFNLLAGLIISFGLNFIINTLIYRSFKFPRHPWSCFSAFWGSLITTDILGICWNLINGADAKADWYALFIHIPIIGCLLGGYFGWRLSIMWDKVPRNYRGLAVGLSMAIASILFLGYIYTGAISYGDQ